LKEQFNYVKIEARYEDIEGEEFSTFQTIDFNDLPGISHGIVRLWKDKDEIVESLKIIGKNVEKASDSLNKINNQFSAINENEK
jgi:hypothetical protein